MSDETKDLEVLLERLLDDECDIAIIKKPRPPFPMDCCTYNYLST